VRIALFSPLIVAGALFACSTFSDAEDTKPPVDGGVETAASEGGDTCKAIVFDPTAPSACAGKDLTSDPKNCGACGHECIDRPCTAGHCEPEQLTDARPIIAIDGTTAYVPVGSKIHRADLTKRPLPVAFEPYFDNQTGTVKHLEVYAGDLYIGWDNNQTILSLSDATPRINDGFVATKAAKVDGHYFPGKTSYYLFDDLTAGVNLARIGADGNVDYKKQNGFLPVYRNGDAIYWTKKLASTANIFGPWEQDNEPIALADPSIGAFAAEGDTVFLVGNGSLSRATRGASAVIPLAKEEGAGIAFAIDGEQLFYVVKRASSLEERYAVYRIDKCRGGEPVPLFDTNQPINAIFLNEPTHVLVNTAIGLFRSRR
jgi:hypothetical protein